MPPSPQLVKDFQELTRAFDSKPCNLKKCGELLTRLKVRAHALLLAAFDQLTRIVTSSVSHKQASSPSSQPQTPPQKISTSFVRPPSLHLTSPLTSLPRHYLRNRRLLVHPLARHPLLRAVFLAAAAPLQRLPAPARALATRSSGSTSSASSRRTALQTSTRASRRSRSRLTRWQRTRSSRTRSRWRGG